MLTEDKSICSPDYWAKVYSGLRNDAKVDSSNRQRPDNTFDRFSWVARYAEGPNVLGVASGHSHIEKRIKSAHPDWTVIASDQTEAAYKVANFHPYEIFSAYKIPFADKRFDTIIITQALEYFEDEDKFLKEASRVARLFLCTVSIGEMKSWSQLRIYTEEGVKQLLSFYGEIQVFERQDDLLLVKMKFNE